MRHTVRHIARLVALVCSFLLVAGLAPGQPGAEADPSGGGAILLERSDGNVWTVDPDGTNLTQISDVPDGWRATGTLGLDSGKSSAFSPDGRRVAYVAFREDRTVVELWTSDPDGTNQVMAKSMVAATSGSVVYIGFAWSPTGAHLGYSASEEVNDVKLQAMIGTTDASGSGRNEIVRNDIYGAPPHWSPDGSRFAYRITAPGSIELWTANADTSGALLAGAATGDLLAMITPVTWRPGGDDLAFVTYTWSQEGNTFVQQRDLWIGHVSGAAPTLVRAAEELESLSWVAWSADGEYLGYRVGRFQAPVYVGELWTAPAADPSLAASISGSDSVSSFAWGPSGHRLVYATGSDLTVVDGDGTNALPLFSPADIAGTTDVSIFLDAERAWSPPGGAVQFSVFYTNDLGRRVTAIWVASIDGSDTHLVIDYPDGSIYGVSWSPTGSHLSSWLRENVSYDMGLWISNADGSANAHVLGAVLGSDFEFSVWSPDGSRFAYATGGEASSKVPNVASVDAAGDGSPIAPDGVATAWRALPSGNQPPSASFSATPETGVAPLEVAFDATASTDPDGTIATYEWDLGDGTQGSGPTTAHTYAAAGTYTAKLTVTDDQGATATATKSIEVDAVSSGADHVKLEFSGGITTTYEGDLTDSDLALSPAATGPVALVRGSGTLVGAATGPRVGFDIRDLWRHADGTCITSLFKTCPPPFYVGQVALVDPGVLAKSTPVLGANGLTRVDEHTARGTSRWIDVRDLPWKLYTLTWTATDGG